MPENEKSKSIGAMWEQDGKRGPYLSGQIEVNGEKIRFVAFKNGYKKEAKQPDWKIMPSVPQGGQNRQQTPKLNTADDLDAQVMRDIQPPERLMPKDEEF